MRWINLAAACYLLSACAGKPDYRLTYQVRALFDKDQAASQVRDGVGTVQGSAFMRQRGGGVVTCAGATVHLIPATQYARERFTRLYSVEGPSASNRGPKVDFEPDPPEYYSLTRSAKCDAQGRFEFTEVAQGAFYLQTQVVWSVMNSREGGNLMALIEVKGAKTVTAHLSE